MFEHVITPNLPTTATHVNVAPPHHLLPLALARTTHPSSLVSRKT